MCDCCQSRAEHCFKRTVFLHNQGGPNPFKRYHLNLDLDLKNNTFSLQFIGVKQKIEDFSDEMKLQLSYKQIATTELLS